MAVLPHVARFDHPARLEQGRSAGMPDSIPRPAGARLLLVEDEAHVRQSLRLSLLDEGYTISEAATGQQALSLLHAADAVLLDRILPDMDGLEVCRRIRSAGDIPIIMVTARADSDDVVAGLEAGADDYVTKPVVGKVLAARVQAVLRRASPAHARTLVAGDLELHPHQGLACRGGKELHLTRTEFRLLVELAAHPGRVVSREELLERVWNYDYFGDTRLLDVHIRRLRTKIEPDPSAPTRLITVRGLGYKLQP